MTEVEYERRLQQRTREVEHIAVHKLVSLYLEKDPREQMRMAALLMYDLAAVVCGIELKKRSGSWENGLRCLTEAATHFTNEAIGVRPKKKGKKKPGTGAG